MATKTLLPNQHVPLHFVYGHDNCCLCNTEKRIQELEQKVAVLKNALSGLYNLAKPVITEMVCDCEKENRVCVSCLDKEKLKISLIYTEKILKIE